MSMGDYILYSGLAIDSILTVGFGVIVLFNIMDNDQ